MGKIRFLLPITSFFILLLLFSIKASLSALEQPILMEGDMIRSVEDDDRDVYIVNEHKYKRLFLNPTIFNFYGHLGGFKNVKLVDKKTRDSFKTSSLFRNCEENDKKVYALELIGEDAGLLRWVNIAGNVAINQDPNFFKKVFCINSREFYWYDIGAPYTSLVQVPDYSFMVSINTPDLGVDLKINGLDNPGPIDWNTPLTATWTSQNSVRCSGMYYIALFSPETDVDNLPTQGTLSFYGRYLVPSNLKNITAQILCYDKNGEYTDDYVSIPINKESVPSLENISISNNKVLVGESYKVTWESKNLNSEVSLILGRGKPGKMGEFWYIAKNIPNTKSYIWNISATITPDTKRATTSSEIESGEYVLLILNAEETIFNSSNVFEIVN